MVNNGYSGDLAIALIPDSLKETLEEGALNRAVMEAIHRITRNEGDFVGAFRQNVIRVIGSYAENSSRTNTQTE